MRAATQGRDGRESQWQMSQGRMGLEQAGPEAGTGWGETRDGGTQGVVPSQLEAAGWVKQGRRGTHQLVARAAPQACQSVSGK